MEAKNIFKKFWFWALVWYAVSVAASMISWGKIGYMGDITTMTIYYTPFKILFFPTLLTKFIIGETRGGYFDGMMLHHLVALPLYFIFSYLISLLIIRKNKKVLS